MPYNAVMNEPRAPFPSHTSSATKMSPGGFRIPPQDAENEKALLGSIMLKPGALYEIEDLVNADSFYAVKHRIITEAMGEAPPEKVRMRTFSPSPRAFRRRNSWKMWGDAPTSQNS